MKDKKIVNFGSTEAKYPSLSKIVLVRLLTDKYTISEKDEENSLTASENTVSRKE